VTDDGELLSDDSASVASTGESTGDVSSDDMSGHSVTSRRPAKRTRTTLPDIAEKQRDKIRDKKFVDFNALLPASTTVRRNKDNYQLVSKDNSLRLEKADKNQRVFDLPTWMQAWNLFVQACIFYATYPLAHLFEYQRRVTRHFARHPEKNVLAFDESHRQRIANNGWSFRHHDREAFEAHLLGANKVRCHTCSNPGHYSKDCPDRGDVAVAKSSPRPTYKSASQATPAASYHSPSYQPPSSSFRGQDRFRAQHELTAGTYYGKTGSSNATPCKFYNSRTAICEKKPCSFSHTCSRCGGRHPTFNCNQGRTDFKPTHI